MKYEDYANQIFSFGMSFITFELWLPLITYYMRLQTVPLNFKGVFEGRYALHIPLLCATNALYVENAPLSVYTLTSL